VPPPASPPFDYFANCFGVDAGGQTLSLTRWGVAMYAASSSSFKWTDPNDAAMACRFWPNPPTDVLTRALNDAGDVAPITQNQIDRAPAWNVRACEAIRLSVQGWYYLAAAPVSGDASQVSATDTSYTRGTNFASCGDNPPPPAPLGPPPPTPPPNVPATCSALAPWWTYRANIANEPKIKRAQCLGISEWFCKRQNTKGKGVLANYRVNHVYCKNADGDIVYCQAQFGTPNCEGEATCERFTPTCDGAGRILDCSDDVGTNNGVGSFNGVYTDSNGKPNCLQKYGLLYEDFVGTCMGNHQVLAGEGDGNPLTAIRIRPCNLDSQVDGVRNLRENLVGLSPGTTELIDTDIPVYRDGYRGNIQPLFYDDITGGTGLTKLNYGFGTNFYSQVPYWQKCDKETIINFYQQCEDDPDTPSAATLAAAGAVFDLAVDFPSPPPDPPNPPPEPPLPPPPIPGIPLQDASAPFSFPYPPPSPPGPPPPTFIRRRLGEKLGMWKRRLQEYTHDAWKKFFPEKARRMQGDKLYSGVHLKAKERSGRQDA
tara:strand:+ start:2583 stop:4205 length:1623 start_codon:yes stop_codon:yes gene_type:complete